MIINKKVKRTIFENKSQYIGSLVLIIISCLLFTMLNQLAENMGRMTNSFETDYYQEDASFTTASKIDNIASLESANNAIIEESSVYDYAVKDGVDLRIFSENTKVNVPAIIEGHKLNTGEILLDPSFGKANNLKAGDQITISNNTFTVAGYMSLPNYIYPLKEESDIISDPNHFGIAVVTKDDFSKVGQGNSSYAVRFNDRNASIDDQSVNFRQALSNQNIVVTNWNDVSSNNRVTFVTIKLDSINKVSTVLPVAILILTCILSGIVIWRLLNNESIIVGTLYAEGYKKQEILNHYMRYPLIVGIIGGVVGTLLGFLCLRPMLMFMVSYFNIPVTAINFNLIYVLISLLLPVVFLGLSGYFILNKELKHSPLELMRGDLKEAKVGFLEKKIRLDRFKFNTKFKLREQLRSFSRLIFLLLGVTIASILLLLGLTVQNSLSYFLNNGIKDAYRFQYEYVYNTMKQGTPPSGAEQFMSSLYYLKSAPKEYFTVCGMPGDSKYIYLKDKSGAHIDPNQVIVTKPLADRFKIKAGDTLTVLNKLNSKEYNLKIDIVSYSYVGQYIFMPISQYNSMVGAPADAYIGVWTDTQLNAPQSDFYRAMSIGDSIDAFGSLLAPLTTVIGVISFLAFVIGLIVIYVVTSMMIEENKMNISLMKIFGYKKKEVNSLILNSSTIIVVVGYLISIPILLGTLSAWLNSLTASMHMTIPVTISIPFLILGFVVVMLVYELSKVLTRRKVYRISMSEALKASME